MDDVDRMYRHLVRTLRATSPQLLTQPFQVGDLYSTILPYRLHRRELGLETNQDYEMAMLELLSGGRGYLVVEDRMRETLGNAMRSPNPDPSVIRDFTSSRVALAPDALAKLEDRPGVDSTAETPLAPAPPIREAGTAPFRASATSTVTAATAPASAARPASNVATGPVPRANASASVSPPSVPTTSGPRRPTRPITVSPTGEQCPHCKGELPAGREISFCPHCGQDLTVLHCPA